MPRLAEAKPPPRVLQADCVPTPLHIEHRLASALGQDALALRYLSVLSLVSSEQ